MTVRTSRTKCIVRVCWKLLTCPNPGCMVVVVFCGSDTQTCQWTRREKAVKLKKELYQAFLICGTLEAVRKAASKAAPNGRKEEVALNS